MTPEGRLKLNPNAQDRIYCSERGLLGVGDLGYEALRNLLGGRGYDRLKRTIERSAAGPNAENQDLKICLDMIHTLDGVASPYQRGNGVSEHHRQGWL